MADNSSVTTSTTIPKYPTLKLVFMIFSLFLPIAAFPLTDIFIRGIWAGRAAGTLPFPPVFLSFLTGGASIFINCAFVISMQTGAVYLYFTCANMSYIILFLFGNFERMVDAPFMTNVPPEAWRVSGFYFAVLFTFLQFAFNSALRSNGRTDEDLGAFGRITNFVWNSLLSGGNGGPGQSLPGNMAIQQSTVSPPTYEEYDDDHIASVRFGGKANAPIGRGLGLNKNKSL